MEEIINKYCPNYDNIVDHEYKKNDTITKHLINYYREFVFKAKEEELNFLKKFDQALDGYLKSHTFHKKVQTYFGEIGNYEDDIISNLIKIYETNEEETLKEIKNTKWI
jgi:hypothetical protein